MKNKFLITTCLILNSTAFADLNVKKVDGDLSKDFQNQTLWAKAEKDQDISMMAQPATLPRPSQTETASIKVAAIHNDEWIVFRLKWTDKDANTRDKLATYSDGVALQFPINNNEVPPAIMMGHKGDPVHIFHWKYEYQIEMEQGKQTIEKIYPNMTTDMYPMDYKNKGNYPEADKDKKDSMVGGTAAGNPQSFAKMAVDEMMAEGFSTSVVLPDPQAKGKGNWAKGEWITYIARPMKYAEGSKLEPGKKSNIAFAVWQGSKNEVAGRKSLTMSWTILNILEK